MMSRAWLGMATVSKRRGALAEKDVDGKEGKDEKHKEMAREMARNILECEQARARASTSLQRGALGLLAQHHR